MSDPDRNPHPWIWGTKSKSLCLQWMFQITFYTVTPYYTAFLETCVLFCILLVAFAISYDSSLLINFIKQNLLLPNLLEIENYRAKEVHGNYKSNCNHEKITIVLL